MLAHVVLVVALVDGDEVLVVAVLLGRVTVISVSAGREGRDGHLGDGTSAREASIGNETLGGRGRGQGPDRGCQGCAHGNDWGLHVGN
jgi:hypothetical protein